MSIIPRGQALGVTLSAPDADVFNYSESYLRGKIKVAVGGRVAEEIAFGNITTGAESDIQQATHARARDGGAVGDERGRRLRGGGADGRPEPVPARAPRRYRRPPSS